MTDKTNPRKLQQALLQLGSGSTALEAEYHKAVVRIDQQPEGIRELAYKVLSWIVYARRELSVDEVREAIAIEEGMDDIDHDTDLEEEDQLVSACAGLLRVDREAGVMRLVHYTTQKYLETVLPERSEGEVLVARNCLTYLTMDVFKQSLLKLETITNHPSQIYKLFWYAAYHWGGHIKPEFEQDLIPYIDKLLFSPKSLQAVIQFLFEEDFDEVLRSTAVEFPLYTEYTIFDPENRFDLPPAHVCAYFGMVSTMLRIIDRGCPIDEKDIMGRTPLLWAAKFGHAEVVKLLLKRPDVFVDSRDHQGWTPFSHATFNGHLNTVEILLRCADVDINSPTNSSHTPLYLAISRGHADVVKLLLDRPGIRIEHLTSGNDDSAVTRTPSRLQLLGLAIQSQGSEMLEVLLGHASIHDHMTAHEEGKLLFQVVTSGTAEQTECVLSTTNASPNTKVGNGQTILCKAARGERTEIVRVLLKHPHVHPDSSDQDGRTPLSYAVECESLEIAEALLQRPDVNPDSIDNVGRTPLSYAAKSGNKEMVQRLLAEPRVQPNSRDHKGRTPLSYAAENGDSDVVGTFLAIPEIETDASDVSGLTPFLWAVNEGKDKVTGLFLRQWFEPADSTGSHATILQKAIQVICSAGKDFCLSDQSRILDTLGRGLLSIGSRYWALFVFQQNVTFKQELLLASHDWVHCDGCRVFPIVGDRFVCTTCIKVDLCAACKDEYDEGTRFEKCANHEFLWVAGQKIPSEAWEGSDQLIETLRKLKLGSQINLRQIQVPIQPYLPTGVRKSRKDSENYCDFFEHLEE